MSLSSDTLFKILRFIDDGTSIASMLCVRKQGLNIDQYPGLALIVDACDFIKSELAVLSPASQQELNQRLEQESLTWKSLTEAQAIIEMLCQRYAALITPLKKDLSEMTESEMIAYFTTQNRFATGATALAGKLGLWLMGLLCLAGCSMTAQSQSSDTSTTLVHQTVIAPGATPLYERNDPLTTPQAQNFSPDLIDRCQVDLKNENFITTLVQPTFKTIPVDSGDDLPDITVKDVSYSQRTVAQIYTDLLRGLNIQVVEKDRSAQKVSVKNIQGSLKDVFGLVGQMGGVFYTYNARKHVITLVPEMRELITIDPQSRDLLLALLDGVQGLQIQPNLINWKESQVVLTLTQAQLQSIRKLLTSMTQSSQMIAYDIVIERFYPREKSFMSWMDLTKAFGQDAVHTTQQSRLGMMMTLSSDITFDDLETFMSQQGGIARISEGSMIAYGDWRSRFDIGQCSTEDRLESGLQLVSKTDYRSLLADTLHPTFASDLVFQTSDGELTSFKPISSIGESILIVGIPLHTFVKTDETTLNPYAEVLIYLRPRLIQFVKKGAQ